MRHHSFVSAVAGVAALAGYLGASPALAGNFLSFVSGKGNDGGNNCAIPGKPCRTLAYALTQTNASGEIKTLDPASYGVVTINKSVTITGVPGAGIAMNAAGTAITINAGANGIVNLRGIEINGQGIGYDGISVITAKAVNIVDCIVRRVLGYGISLSPNSGAVSATVSNTISSNNGYFGIRLLPGAGASVHASVDHTTTNDNGVSGVLVDPNATVMITDSIANNNGTSGYMALGNAANLASGNATSVMRLGRSVATGNPVGIDNVSGATLQSFGDNKVFGNVADVSGTVTAIAHK